MEEIIRFQKYMLLIRRTVGWTAEEFGEKIGVTRQTINNLEKNNRDKFKLNKTQYIAMRSVLDAEMSKYPDETEMLRLILDDFIDNPENYPDEDRERLLNKANMLTPSILAGTTSRKDVSKELIAVAAAVGFAAALAPLSIGLAAGSTVTAGWLAKTIFRKD